MRQAGEVVGRFELLEHVWDAYGASEANVVEVYVGYLRRKIDAPFGRKRRDDGARRRLPARSRRRLTGGRSGRSSARRSTASDAG